MEIATNIGSFFQGQSITISISNASTATAEEKNTLKVNNVYLGIYHDKRDCKDIILSTEAGSLVKSVSTEGNVSIVGVLTPKQTKDMMGGYVVEMMIKSTDDTFTSMCKNLIVFSVKPRRIASVIK